tara:strand:- start:116 stop:1348 length:1233 start_codon:yes stop_codon:yes gene_type:complete
MYEMNKYLNKIGFFSLILFFTMVSIHFWTIEKISYFYKEIFAFIFLLLTVPFLRQKKSFHLKSELWFYLLFIIFVLLSSLLIESRILYPGSAINSPKDYDVNGNIYVIRNVLIYLPMLIYIYKRRLTFKEITFLLKVISVFGFISIIVYLSFYNISTDLESALKLFTLGGYFMSYNTFIPYLTFPFISAIYLALTQDSRINKIFYFIIAFLIFSYIVISTSRQSIIFCIVALLIYLSFNRKIFKKVSITIIFTLILSSLILPDFLSDIEVSEKLISKTTSIDGLTNDETNRFETAKEGLYKLYFFEYLVGAGVSSVVISGPHNDFIRWIQRVGIIGASLGFMPFIISFIGSLKLMRKKYSIFHAFIFLAIFYTPYISLFGYPRDDAFQAPYVWLGLSLWLIVDKSKFNNK